MIQLRLKPSGCILVFIMFSFGSMAQPWMLGNERGGSPNFFEIQKEAEAYFQGREQESGIGYKPYKRWEWYWQSRINPDGSFPVAGITLNNWNQYVSQKEKEGNNRENFSNCSGNWASHGPATTPGGYEGIGRINCVAFHPTNPNIIWVGSAGGGAWVTDDGGTTWVSRTDEFGSLGISSILIHPTNPNTIYLATGDFDGGDNYSIGILKSTNGGFSWNSTGLSWFVGQYNLVSKMIFDPDDASTLLVSTNSGLYKTMDGGIQWSKVNSGVFYDVKAHPNAATNIMYAATGDKIYKSSNNGTSWSLVQSFDYCGRIALAVSPASPNYVYAVCTYNNPYSDDDKKDNGFLGLYRSTNSGSSFSLRSSSPNILSRAYYGNEDGGQGWYDLCIAADPNNAETVYVGGINIWKSTNGGSSWVLNAFWSSSPKPAVHADHHCLEWQNSTLWNGNDGGIYKTTNGGTSWQSKSNSLVISQMYRIGVSQTDRKVIAGLQDNGTNLRNLVPIPEFPYEEEVWSKEIGGDGLDCAINPINGNILYGSTQYGGSIQRSVNGGVSWGNIRPAVPSSEAKNAPWLVPMELDPSNPSTIYLAYKRLYKSVNQGSSWVAMDNGLGGSKKSAIAVAPSNSNYIYVIGGATLFRTTNGGGTWSTVTTPQFIGAISAIEVHPENPNIIWIVASNYSSGRKVFMSSNGGVTWANISGSLPNLPANCIVYQNGTANGLYVGMDIGVFYLDDNLSDWQVFNGGLPNVEIMDLEIDYTLDLIYAATYGRGLWSSDLHSEQMEGVYTVGEDEDYETLTEAIAAYNSSCLTGHVVFELTDDSYSVGPSGLSVFQNPSAAYDRTLTIRPAQGNAVIIGGGPSAGTINLIGADHVYIDGLNTGGASLMIQNTLSIDNSAAIALTNAGPGNGCENVAIRNCKVRGGSNTNSGSYAIYVGGAIVDPLVWGGYHNFIYIENNQIEHAYYGVFVAGNAVEHSDGISITDNIIGSDAEMDYVTFRGIDISNSNFPYVSRNLIKNMKVNFNVTIAAINFGQNVNYALVSENEIIGIYSEGIGTNGAYGINFGSSVNVSNNVIINNAISDIRTINTNVGATTYNAFGIRLTGGIDTRIYYNSVHLFGTISLALGQPITPLSAALVVTSNSVEGLDLRNNILSNQQVFTEGTPKIYSVWVPSGFTFLQTDYNDFFGEDGPPGNLTQYAVGRIGSVDYEALEDWQQITLQDSHSVSVLPVFVSDTDLHLVPASSGGLNENATPILYYYQDIDGDFRHGLTPDIGCDEVGAPLLVDAGVTGITIGDYTCAGPNAVTVEVHNFGTVALNRVSIAFILNPGGSLTTYQADNINIEPGESQSFMVGSVFLEADSTYMLTASTYLPNSVPDGVTTNDTFDLVNIQTGLVGVYEVGTNGDFATLTEAIQAYNSSPLCGHVVFELIHPLYSASNGEVFPIVINHHTDASVTTTLTIRPSFVVAAAIIGSTGAEQALIKLNGADYIHIDGVNQGGSALTIENTSTNANTGPIWIASQGANLGAVHNGVHNCILKAGSNTVNSTFGIHVGGTTISVGSFYGTPGPNNDYTTIEGNKISKASFGIYVRAPLNDMNDSLVIRDNEIGSTVSSDYIKITGIDVWGAVSPVIDRNYVYNIKSTGASVTGISFGSWIYGAKVINNRIEGLYNESVNGNYAYGIDFSWNQFYDTNLVANNFITDIRTINYAWFNAYEPYAVGLVLQGGTNFKVYHNTINMFGNISIISGTSNNPGSAAFQIQSTSVTGLKLKNNIFINKQVFNTGAPKIYSVVAPANYVFEEIDYNDYYGSNGPPGNPTVYHVGRRGTTSYTTLASWQAATGQDAHSHSINPVFVSDIDLHLVPTSNVDLDSLGVPVAGVNLDWDEEIRDTTFPDIGADEFSAEMCMVASPGDLMALPSDVVCQDQDVLLTSAGYSTGIGLLFIWYTSPPGENNWTLLQSSDYFQPLSLPGIQISADYQLAVFCSDGTMSYAVIEMTVNTRPSASIDLVGSSCLGEDIHLTAVTDIGTSFYWTGPNNFISSLQTPAVINASEASSGIYQLTTFANNGCVSPTVSKEVVMSYLPADLSIWPDYAIICPDGEAEQVSVNSSISTSGTIGEGEFTYYVTTPFVMDAGARKMQYLFLASELAAMGLSKGDDISSLSIKVLSKPMNYLFKNLTIGLKHTPEIILTSAFQTGTTTVYGPKNFYLTGAAPFDLKFLFSSSFEWNGTSNILVEFCFNNNDNPSFGNGAAGIASHNTTAPLSTRESENLNSNFCANPGGGYTANARINITFDFIKYPSMYWYPNGPGSGLFLDANAMTAYEGQPASVLYCLPDSTTRYTISANYGSQFAFNGKFDEPDWGAPLATSEGGPAPSFGGDHRLNALYLRTDQFSNAVNLALAGNIKTFCRALLFIDSKPGGYSNGGFGRDFAPVGISNFHYGTTFDTGFLPDYCLEIETDEFNNISFFNLYTLSGSNNGMFNAGGGPNINLGSNLNPQEGAQLGVLASVASFQQGYEMSIPKSLLEYAGDSLKVMAMYISDVGFLSNQFLTHAGSNEGSYGDGPVHFGNLMPDPVIIPTSNRISTCYKQDSILIGREGKMVKNPQDAGLHSLRGVYGCITEGDTITYDQEGLPFPTNTSLLSGPLYITKDVVIKGLNDLNRPRIFIDQNVTNQSIILSPGKILTLDNIDIILINPENVETFSNPGSVLIENTVQIRKE